MSQGKVAQCGCGALRLEVDGAPEAVVACHCVDCQRRSGSPFGVAAYYPKDNVRITGESKQYTRTTAAGRLFHQHFCLTCGSTVYFWGPNKPDAIGVAVGAFADAGFPAPVRSVWEQSRHDWVALPDGLQRFPQGRDSTPLR